MSSNTRVSGSGDGTRPTTDGGTNNIGAGEKFSTKRNAAGEEISGGPAPTEGMQHKRKNVDGTKHDDAAAFDLTENLESTPNTEPRPKP